MNLPKMFSVLRPRNVCSVVKNKNAVPVLFGKRYSSSASSTTVESTTSQDSALDEEKKTMKGPFIKNLFVGVFDTAMLEYPEYSSMEYIFELDKLISPVDEYFMKCVDSKKIDEMKEIPEDNINAIKEHNLYALQTPRHLGGWEVDNKCFARYFEAVGTDLSITTALTSHYRALNMLLSFGTSEHKETLIRKMTTGELKVAICITEKPTMLNFSEIDTTALPGNGNNWTLKGKKIWVTDGDKADYFLVFAKTWQGTINPQANSEVTVFLVPRNATGVECSAKVDQLGTRGIGICDVTFNDVSVTNEDIIGEIGTGNDVAIDCLSKTRLSTAAAAIGYLKDLLNNLAEYTTHTKIDGKSLYTMEYYQKHLGAIATDIYALESMVYFTAGIKDNFDNPDLTLEEAVVKIFSMEKIVKIVDLCANLVGNIAYIKGSSLERSIRDARSYLIHDIVPLNVTKLHVATLGLQHAGVTIESEIKKARNPFNFPAFAMKNFFNDRKALDDDIKISNLLRLSVHPSLSGDADKLETCVLRLECIVKNLFRRWGIEIVDRHMDLIRLADCVVTMYGMAAVVSRASRAYCIGLSNSNYDLAISNIFCGTNSGKIKETFELLYSGPMETYDTPSLVIGQQVAMQKGYFFQHPLARNY